jgi:hypothetical protein
VRDESSQLVRLSTRDVAPADRLSYASSILGSALAQSALSTGTPAEYELDVTALELPSIAIVAASGSQTRSIRGPSEIRRTSQRYFSLANSIALPSRSAKRSWRPIGMPAASEWTSRTRCMVCGFTIRFTRRSR